MLLLKLICVMCLLAHSYCYSEDYEEVGYTQDNSDFDSYQEEDYSESIDDEANVRITRVRRIPPQPSVRTLNPREMREVREALNQLLRGNDESGVTVESANIGSTWTSGPTTTDNATIDEIRTTLMNLYAKPMRTRFTPKLNFYSIVQDLRQRHRSSPREVDFTNMLNVTNATTTASTKSWIRTARYPIDVPALLDLIAELAADFETNLTMKLRESLTNMTLPTCETTMTQTTSEYDANATGAVIAKCFVCGLESEGIPRDSQCADAFAGDFIPLVPVDPTARAKISRYRKYCKYLNIKGHLMNQSQPRSFFGRWTGGCSVRWTDMSGVYTQRTCRSRYGATMGRHFASKRMARLEMALLSVDNGCIISPMAVLLPLSRGISLYARFHACVCTGNWCNQISRHAPNFPLILLFFLFSIIWLRHKPCAVL